MRRCKQNFLVKFHAKIGKQQNKKKKFTQGYREWHWHVTDINRPPRVAQWHIPSILHTPELQQRICAGTSTTECWQLNMSISIHLSSKSLFSNSDNYRSIQHAASSGWSTDLSICIIWTISLIMPPLLFIYKHI